MSIYSVCEHPVTVAQIVSIKPLLVMGSMMSPSQGVILVMDDGSNLEWFLEKDGQIPADGDHLVFDSVLKTRYVVDAAKLAELFVEVSAVA